MSIRFKTFRSSRSLQVAALAFAGAVFINTVDSVSTSAANGPADGHIKAAIYDLSRAEQQSIGLTVRNAAKIKRVQRGLEAARNQLVKSSHKDHASYKAASRRLETLEARLASLFTDSGKPASVKQAGVLPATRSEANGLTAGDRAQLASVERQVRNFVGELQKVTDSDLQRPHAAAHWRGRVEHLYDQYRQVSRPKHRQALVVAKRIVVAEQHLAVALARSNAAGEGLADMKAAVAEIEKRSYGTRVPHVPSLPASRETLFAYAKTLSTMRAQALADNHFLRSIDLKASEVHQATINDLIGRTDRLGTRDVPRAAQSLISQLERAVDHPRWRVDQLAKTDPANPDHQTNRLLNERERNLTMGAFREAIEAIALISELEATLGLEPKDRSVDLAIYRGAMAHFEEKYEIALGVVRFPEVRSVNQALRAAAETVLSNPNYKVHTILRLEIVSDKQRRNRTEAQVEAGAVNTTVAATRYLWDEFSVTTAEEVDGEVYLFHNLLKYFHEGGTDVPIGKWTLGKRWKSKRILKENVHL